MNIGSKFLTRKNIRNIKKVHGITIYTQKWGSKQNKEIEVIGKLAKANVVRKAKAGMIRLRLWSLDDPGDSRKAILSTSS